MRFRRLTQKFPRPQILVAVLRDAVHQELHRAFGSHELSGKSIALLLSSRGILNYDIIVRAVAEYFIGRGMTVFGLPAMGSHGGATEEGQLAVLASYGITEATMGFPIDGSMDATQIGTIMEGTPVFVASSALKADFIFPINRVKPHTQIYGEMLGSGCSKMLAIGIGKLLGPKGYHALVTKTRTLGEVVRAAAALVLQMTRVLGGLAIVDNAYHETALVGAVRGSSLFADEGPLYQESCRLMPYLPLMKIGVLLIGKISKKFSGSGMDPNITGRFWFDEPVRPGHPDVTHISVMDSYGGKNYLGVGFSDSCNRRVFEGIDPTETVVNAETGGRPELAYPPKLLAENDRELIEIALDAAGTEYPLVYMLNTLTCDELWVSEHGARDIRPGADMEWGDTIEAAFDANGNFTAPTFQTHL